MNIVYNEQGKKKRWQYPYSRSCAKDRSGNPFVCALRGQKIGADSLTLRSRDAPKLHPGMRVTVKGVGPRFEGEYRCRKVLHTLGRKMGFLTRFVAERNAKDRNTAVELGNAGVSPVAARQAQEQQAANGAEEEEAGDTPAFSNLRWEKDGAAVTEALVDDKVSLCFDVENIPDGASVNVSIWEHDDDDEHDHVGDEAGTVRNGKVEIEWQVEYVPDEDDGSTSAKELKEKGYTLPEYHFVAEYDGVESRASAVLDVWGKIKLVLNKIFANMDFTIQLADGTEVVKTTDDKGCIALGGIPFGNLTIEEEGETT